MIKKAFKLVFILCLFTYNASQAQVTQSELKAAFIYQFSNNIGWTNQKLIKSFEICLLGDNNELLIAMNNMAKSKTIKGKPISVTQINDINNIEKVHVLFVSSELNIQIKEIWEAIEMKNILLITEECPDLKYVMLNLYSTEDGKYSFQINKANIVVENLIVEPELLLLGGTEIDVRELYREMKQQLSEEQQLVELQRSVIEKQLLKIIEYQEGIDSLKQNSDSLFNQIIERESNLIKLKSKINNQENILSSRTEQIMRQENEIDTRGAQIKKQVKEIKKQLENLDSLSTSIKQQKDLIKSQNDSILIHQSKIELQQRMILLFVVLSVVVLALVISLFRAYRIKKRLSSILEDRVNKRTAELQKTNEDLVKEVWERKQVQDKLVKSERNYREIFNAASEAFFIYNVKNGEILDANTSFEKMFGYSLNEISNVTLVDLSSNQGEYTLDNVLKKVQLAVNEGPQVFEWMGKKKSGELFWSEISLKSADIGGKQRVLAVIRNISEKKKVEAELEKHRTKLEFLVKERTNELTAINEELNVTNEELNNTNELLNSQKIELEKALQQLKDAQVQLVQSEKMASLGVLTAGIAHEINNPVNFITSSIYGVNNFVSGFNKMYDLLISLINKSTEENITKVNELSQDLDFDFMREQVNEIVSNISLGADRISNIVKGLRTFTRQDSKMKQDVDLNENLDITLTMLQHELKDKITVYKKYGDIPKVLCYIGQVNQVFMNIIVNAIQALKAGGEIVLESNYCSNNEFVCVSIKDNGTGMDEKTKDKLFEPFFTTKEVGEGSGLGMYISYKIIKEHNGEIIVNSNVNKGTEFIVKLPINN